MTSMTSLPLLVALIRVVGLGKFKHVSCTLSAEHLFVVAMPKEKTRRGRRQEHKDNYLAGRASRSYKRSTTLDTSFTVKKGGSFNPFWLPQFHSFFHMIGQFH